MRLNRLLPVAVPVRGRHTMRIVNRSTRVGMIDAFRITA